MEEEGEGKIFQFEESEDLKGRSPLQVEHNKKKPCPVEYDWSGKDICQKESQRKRKRKDCESENERENGEAKLKLRGIRRTLTIIFLLLYQIQSSFHPHFSHPVPFFAFPFDRKVLFFSFSFFPSNFFLSFSSFFNLIKAFVFSLRFELFVLLLQDGIRFALCVSHFLYHLIHLAFPLYLSFPFNFPFSPSG